MKQATKQRIVGTVVLLALGLIFLPIIFDGQGSYQIPVSSRIPEAPEVPILPEPEPDRPQIQIPERRTTANTDSDDSSIVEQTPEVDTSAAATAVEVVESEPAFQREVPELGEEGLPEGWVVRLGTFANGDNARALVERLQASGYKAYSRSVSGNQGQMTAVYVGPWLDRARVEEYQQQLQEQFQLAGMIVRYEIEQL